MKSPDGSRVICAGISAPRRIFHSGCTDHRKKPPVGNKQWQFRHIEVGQTAPLHVRERPCSFPRKERHGHFSWQNPSEPRKDKILRDVFRASDVRLRRSGQKRRMSRCMDDTEKNCPRASGHYKFIMALEGNDVASKPEMGHVSPTLGCHERAPHARHGSWKAH